LVNDFGCDTAFSSSGQPQDQADVGRLQGLGDRIALSGIEVYVADRHRSGAHRSPAFHPTVQYLYMNWLYSAELALTSWQLVGEYDALATGE
jgi:hypothetical protein